MADEALTEKEAVPVNEIVPDRADFDRPAFEKTVESRLQETMAKLGQVDEVEPKADKTVAATPTEVDETPVAEETPETTEEAAAEATTEQEEKPVVADPKAPILPDAYRRSLKAYEWTDDEITNALAQGGQKFVESAAKMHQTRSKELAGWAELGRKQRPETPVVVAEKPSVAVQTGTLKPVDVKALKAKYGDEALIDEIVGPVNALMDQINQILPQVRETQAASQTAKQENLGRQIDGFFGSENMKAHATTYGTETGKLAPEQLSSRNKVLELADALIGGASLQGRQLSFNEAMELAHDSVTGPAKEQAARTKLTSQLQQRAKGISLKPGTRKPGAGAPLSAAANRSALEKRTTSALQKAFA